MPSSAIHPRGPELFALLVDPARVHEVPADAIPALLCQLSAIQSALAAKLMAPARTNSSERSESDRLLTADEAASILGVTPRWLYRHQRLPFVRKLSRKALRVSEVGLRHWLAAKKT